MQIFWMNNQKWRMVRVPPSSGILTDRTGRRTVATTDPQSHLVCIANHLTGDDLARVTIHEMAHAAMVSFGMLDDIHAWAHPDRWIEAEEWACNFIADYGMVIFKSAYALIGDLAWHVMPAELGALVR